MLKNIKPKSIKTFLVGATGATLIAAAAGLYYFQTKKSKASNKDD